MHKLLLRGSVSLALVAGLGLAACNGASSSQAGVAGSSVAPATSATTPQTGALRASAIPSSSPAAAAALPLVVVTKSPTCGCCHLWVEHMQKAGFEVEVHDVQDINLAKERVGVPYGKGSCHTAEVGGYFVEGHVPAEDVKRLLVEKPDAKGLAVPGMPAGSPGMEMPDGRVQPYVVELVARDGSTSVFAHHGQ
ncbi:MAG: DUF411 domain-containing protein [Lysobacteraceae bacterium]|nr:MAG: DUF411 domain-containing protein [Xanthomonadaceae bacterium]